MDANALVGRLFETLTRIESMLDLENLRAPDAVVAERHPSNEIFQSQRSRFESHFRAPVILDIPSTPR